MKVLSLFSGCGGMDLGFEGGFEVYSKSFNPKIHPDWAVTPAKKRGWVVLPSTGFKTVFSNDIMRPAKAAWLPHFKQKNKGLDDETFRLESIVNLVKRHRKGEKVFPEDISVVTGGFPCQDFSVAGKRQGFKSKKAHHGALLGVKDEPSEENRGMLYWWMREVVDITQPKVFVAENVKGLISLEDAKEIIENDFSQVGGGYTVVPARVLAAYDYGVPQTRERVIFFGFKNSALTNEAKKALKRPHISSEYDPYPKPTHFWAKIHSHMSEKNNEQRMPHVPVIDVLKDLPEPWLSNDLSQQSYSKAKWYGNHCQGQTEIKPTELAPTIRAEHHGNIEFRRLSIPNGGVQVNELQAGLPQRRLSVRECARIQTFPDDFVFVRKTNCPHTRLSASEGYKLIGNAVPPLLAFNISMRLRENWEKYFGCC